jgi:hypothetical protein
VPGRRLLYSFLALLAAGFSSYLVVLGLDPGALPNDLTPEHASGAEGVWSLVLDFGAYLLAIIGGLVLGAVALLLVAAVVFRLPGLGALAKWIARQGWGEPEFAQRPWMRPLRWIARELVAAFNWLVGYDLVVEDFAPHLGSAGGSTTAKTDDADDADGGGASDLREQADTVTAAVRATLGASGLPPGPGGVDYVKASGGEGSVLNAISDAMKEVQELKWLAPLVRLGRMVLPRQTFSIHGHLLPAGERGRGLALAVAERGGVVGTATLWERTYDPALGGPTQVASRRPETLAEALYRLGVGAAAWSVYRVLDTRKETRKRALLGTDNWHSYAYFRAGLECQEGRRSDKAQALYVRALERDAENRAAMFNLAVLNARDTEGKSGELAQEKFEQAIERLRRVRGLIEREEERRSKRREVNGAEKDCRLLLLRDPLWYQAGYHLVAARLEKGAVPPELEQGWREALELTIDLERALRELKKTSWPKRKAIDLNDVLTRVEGPMLILLASLALARGKGEPECKVRRDEPSPEKLLGRLQEELGRIKEVEAGASSEPGGVPAIAAYIIDTYFHPKGENRARLSYRARYNLACYYARRASLAKKRKDRALRNQCAEKALFELRFGIEAGSLAEWATKDRSLEWLRKNRGSEFRQIVAPYLTQST